jgi:hypothetical protein
MDQFREKVARQLLLKNAIFSPISALILGAGIVLVGLGVDIPVLSQTLGASPAWWLAGVLPLWAGYIATQVTSKSAGEAAVQQAIREQFDTNTITNPHLKMNVVQAMAYRERIDKAVERFSDSGMHTRMQDVANQVEEWVRRIYTLSRRLDTFRNDGIIANDLKGVPESIRKLRERLAREDNAEIRAELEDTIRRRQAQFESLDRLETTMDRAELQLENTLTALGTVYSQMLLIDAKDVDSSKTQRLRENILEQVNSLNDVITTMDEVYSDDPLARGRANMGADGGGAVGNEGQRQRANRIDGS